MDFKVKHMVQGQPCDSRSKVCPTGPILLIFLPRLAQIDDQGVANLYTRKWISEKNWNEINRSKPMQTQIEAEEK